MTCEIAGWVRPSCFAAATMVPAFATATKISSDRIVIPGPAIPGPRRNFPMRPRADSDALRSRRLSGITILRANLHANLGMLGRRNVGQHRGGFAGRIAGLYHAHSSAYT